MAFRMQCVQFQSQAPSDPDERLLSPLPSEASASGQQTEAPASVDGVCVGGAALEQLPRRCRVPQRRGDPDTPKAVQMFDQYVG